MAWETNRYVRVVQAQVCDERSDNQPIQVAISDVVTPSEIVVESRPCQAASQKSPEPVPQLIPVRFSPGLDTCVNNSRVGSQSSCPS